MVSLQQRQYHCLTLCYRSITTGELKQLKLCSLRPEEVAQWKEMLENARDDVLHLHPRERSTALNGSRPTPPTLTLQTLVLVQVQEHLPVHLPRVERPLVPAEALDLAQPPADLFFYF